MNITTSIDALEDEINKAENTITDLPFISNYLRSYIRKQHDLLKGALNLLRFNERVNRIYSHEIQFRIGKVVIIK